MRSSHKDGLCTDSVHVDAHSRLQVIQVNVTVLCDQIYDSMLVTNLGRTRGREKISIQRSTYVYLKLMSSRGLFLPA